MSNNIQNLIKISSGLVNQAIGIVAGIALLVFFWGLVRYVFVPGSEVEKVKAKNVMVYGLLALFVMVSVWGITAFFASELQLNNITPNKITNPQAPFNKAPCGGVFQNPCF